MIKERLIITVDGPAGVGKSSVSKALSKRISYVYLDTGALYRAVAFRVAESGISPDDREAISRFCENIDISLLADNRGMKILADGDDITDKIRTEKISILASTVSVIPAVREALLPIQRKAANSGGVIAEGRDMGTVVFPDADVKFFVKAHIHERTKRRYLQLKRRGVAADFEEIKSGIVVRDRQDMKRNVSPLRPAEDSFILDTTDMKMGEVVEKMISVIKEKTGAGI
ncbi:MAG: (d)CMP kinase [Thermodesulfobacteriota bacterium]|nr:(d)CMP kinase [Thermodesulfobacteriota bacterium]